MTPVAGSTVLAQDLFRVRRGNFLDVHAAGGARDDDRTAGRAIDQEAQIQLALDLQAFLDEHASDLPAFRAGLVRDERHADHLFRQALGFVGRFRQLDAAALAAAARMDLRLHDDDAGAEPLGDGRGIMSGGGDFAARNGHAESRED